LLIVIEPPLPNTVPVVKVNPFRSVVPEPPKLVFLMLPIVILVCSVILLPLWALNANAVDVAPNVGVTETVVLEADVVANVNVPVAFSVVILAVIIVLYNVGEERDRVPVNPVVSRSAEPDKFIVPADAGNTIFGTFVPENPIPIV